MKLFKLFCLGWIGCCLMSVSASSQNIERGVSLELAEHRKATLSDLRYKLDFELQKSGPINGKLVARFEMAEAGPVVLDFNNDLSLIQRVNGTNEDESTVEGTKKSGHLSFAAFKAGANRIEIDFVAGDTSLNRNENFLYTLLVPDRASTVFPCFDQPDLKARFQLNLELPKDWIASANGTALNTEDRENGRTFVQYAETKPISTYLFAFAAGEFQKITREIDGRTMTLFHRETDAEKVSRNVDKVFQTHGFALEWLEKYTDIPYPFAKFDFVLIPSFQYGGMEHTGNIFYNADQLFLDESATKDQKLNRARLISHETAHMWFGNLVTMKWFNDVWLKEVFANFMAAKIVNPSFPEINHNLGFMLKHHPIAYGEDRTRGSHPIQQRLENLQDAGTLYGRIIYQKAPVVMRQLETMIGEDKFQEGLQEYLKKFEYNNAVWDDLISILDAKSDIDLRAWSNAWVKEAGTPKVATDVTHKPGQRIGVAIRQTQKTPKDRFWSQQVDVKFVADNVVVYEERVFIDGEPKVILLPETIVDYDFFLVNGSELGYGYFEMDGKSRDWLLENVASIDDDVIRGAAWLTLYETLIRTSDLETAAKITPVRFLETLMTGLEIETEALNRQNILKQISTVYWRLLSPEQQQAFAERLESELWRWVDAEDETVSSDAKSAYYKSLVSIAQTPSSITRLKKIWQEESGVGDLPLSEIDYMTLAYELAVRLPQESQTILDTQLSRIENVDRKKRFEFVMPALSSDAKVREAFFNSLKQQKNRRPERWALDGVAYLHHPLRAKESESFILPSLELLEEIQETGDIFFPKRWLVATLSGHQSSSAANTVRDFLAERPEYPYRLKNKILQSADLLMRFEN